MRIGVIGSGHIGATVARRLVAAGHEVAIANSRGRDAVAATAHEVGAEPATAQEAAAFADRVVIEAVPFGAYPGLPADALEGKVVVDASNYYPGRDGTIPEAEDGRATSRLVQDHLPGSRVVKAFNTIYWQRIRDEHRPAGDPDRLAVPVAGDDEEAKTLVSDLVDQIGFDPVDAGSLDDSVRQQPDTPVYNRPLDAAGVRAALASAA
jgi:8-hydroxy-5-deazaflavin:NADPH oxidoreductase